MAIWLTSSSTPIFLKFLLMMTENSDPLFYGTTYLEKYEVPKFTKGERIFSELHKFSGENKLVKDILVAPENIITLFKKLFPKLHDYNEIGELQNRELSFWKEGMNDLR